MQHVGRRKLTDIRVAVVGASGYSGLELLKLLVQHPQVRIARLFGNSSIGKRIDEVHPSLRHVLSLPVEQFSAGAVADCDIAFIALPSGHSMSLATEILHAGCKVIDLGGDFRLSDADEYLRYYGHEHTATPLLEHAVYGLSEWNTVAIKQARLLSNPGCYPTSIQLGLLPLLKSGLIDDMPVAITSYSGTSGAGKSVTEKMIFAEVNESVRAYKVGNHQHIPEIRRFLREFGGRDVAFSFVPHLLPATRGIYTTMHVRLRSGVSQDRVEDAYNNAYVNSPFVRVIVPAIPELKDVACSNFCDIGYVMDGEMLVVFSALDNLGKGAAGQAIQNMNLMTGISQTEGLLPCYKKN